MGETKTRDEKLVKLREIVKAVDICMLTTVDEGDVIVTVAKELPPVPVTEVGLSVSDEGGCCGVSVTCACADVPP